MSNRLQALAIEAWPYLAILIACVGAGWGTDRLARSWGDALQAQAVAASPSSQSLSRPYRASILIAGER